MNPLFVTHKWLYEAILNKRVTVFCCTEPHIKCLDEELDSFVQGHIPRRGPLYVQRISILKFLFLLSQSSAGGRVPKVFSRLSRWCFIRKTYRACICTGCGGSCSIIRCVMCLFWLELAVTGPLIAFLSRRAPL